MRKAAVAKANWEYRAYASGNPMALMHPMLATDLELKRAKIDKLRQGPGTKLDEHQRQATGVYQRDFGGTPPTTSSVNDLPVTDGQPPDDTTATQVAMSDEPENNNE